jgi:hypothetical protein
VKLRGLCAALAFLCLPACQSGEVTGIGEEVGGDDNPGIDAGDPPDPIDDPDASVPVETPDADVPVETPDAAIGDIDAAVEAPDAGPLAPLTFTDDIYPRLQINGELALACAQCHTDGSIASGFVYDDGVQATYNRIMGKAGVVVLDDPTASDLLNRPLKIPAENHPVKLFDNVDDAGAEDDFAFEQYSIFLRWIEEGATL